MRYKFLAAYSVRGMGMTAEHGHVTIFQEHGVHVYLTHDATQPLALIDRQTALAYLCLNALVGHDAGPDAAVARNIKVAEIVDQRAKKFKGYGFLMVEIDGHVDAAIPALCKRVEDFFVCFDAFDKKTLEASLQPNIVSAISAVRMAGETGYRFEKVTKGSYLVDDSGAVVHSLSLNGGAADFTIGRQLRAEQIVAMRGFIGPLRRSPELALAVDLYSQSVNRQETKLRSFMAAWNALELFLKKTKGIYGTLWLAERNNPATLEARLSEIESIPDTGSELARIFGKISCYLGGDRQIMDIVDFLRLIKVRNRLSHELDDADLPVDCVHRLLDKYMKGHLIAARV